MSGYILHLIYAYFIGGITFIPVCCTLLFLYFNSKITKKQKVGANDENGDDSSLLVDIDPAFKAGELEELQNVNVEMSGYMYVTNQYYYHPIELIENPTLSQPQATTYSGSTNKDTTSGDSLPNSDNNDNQMILTRSQLKSKQKFYVTLKHGNLFLYKEINDNNNNSSSSSSSNNIGNNNSSSSSNNNNNNSNDLLHAISLKDCFVTIWPRNYYDMFDNKYHLLTDGQLFTKRTCIAIFKKGSVRLEDPYSTGAGAENDNLQFSVNLNRDIKGAMNPSDISTLNGEKVSSDQLFINGANQFFLYFDNNMDKEDWYFKLINACKNNKKIDNISPLNPSISAITAHLNTHDILMLIQNLNSTEGQLQSKWFNALLGRIFLSLQQTDTLNKFIWDKIYKKLLKINKPGFLDDFIIEKVDVGNSIPFITNPKLIELTPEGSTKIGFDLIYNGNLKIIISTKVNISLGSRFKSREVTLKISVEVKKLIGPIIIMMKPPPSNRLWYAFQKQPVMDLDIEPIVSSSKLAYTVITNAIKSKFADTIKESLVVPYMDDIVIYNTENELYRGGIWDHSLPADNNRMNSKENKIPTSKEYIKLKRESKIKASTSKEDSVNSFSSYSQMQNKVSSTARTNVTKGTTSDNTQKTGDRVSLSPGEKVVNGDDNVNNDTNRSVDSTLVDSLSASKGKKLFKNSINKINKWYKENVGNSSDIDENEVDYSSNNNELNHNDVGHNINSNTNKAVSEVTGSKINPTMISNRRTTISKMVDNEIYKRTTDILGSGTSTDNNGHMMPPKRNQTAITSELTLKTPELPAKEMFINETVMSPLKADQRLNNGNNSNVIQNQFVEQDRLNTKVFIRKPPLNNNPN